MSEAKLYYAVSWFAQQSVEKGLKALYIERHGTLASRTHDLDYLGKEVAAPAVIEAELRNLNSAFERARYPNVQTRLAPVDDVTEYDAIRDLEAAKKVLKWLAQELGEKLPQS